MNDDDQQVIVGRFTYERRDYTPSPRNRNPGHGWLRKVDSPAAGATGRSECSQEGKTLVDEIVRLRALLDEHGIPHQPTNQENPS